MDLKYHFPPATQQDFSWTCSQTSRFVNDGSKLVLSRCHAPSRHSNNFILHDCGHTCVENCKKTSDVLTTIQFINHTVPILDETVYFIDATEMRHRDT